MILMLISGYVLPGIFADFNAVNLLVSAYALSFLLPAVVFGVISRKNAMSNFKPAAKGTFKFSFSSVFLLVCTAILTKCIIAFVTGKDASQTGVLLSSAGLLESLLCYTLLPAVLEEIIFRGIAFSLYQKTCGGFGAILATSVFFGMAHFSEEEFLSYFVSGIILGTTAYITRSVLPAIILHLANNTASFFLENAVFKIASETKSGILAIFLITAVTLIMLFWFLYELEGVCKKRYLSSPKNNTDESFPALYPDDGSIMTSIKRTSFSPLFIGGIMIFAIFCILV
jgi:membrane protease YdiL (CAAX protease family)